MSSGERTWQIESCEPKRLPTELYDRVLRGFLNVELLSPPGSYFRAGGEPNAASLRGLLDEHFELFQLGRPAYQERVVNCGKTSPHPWVLRSQNSRRLSELWQNPFAQKTEIIKKELKG